MKNVKDYINKKHFIIKTLTELVVKVFDNDNVLDIKESRDGYRTTYDITFDSLKLEIVYPTSGNIDYVNIKISKFMYSFTILKKEFDELINPNLPTLVSAYKNMLKDGQTINQIYTLVSRKEKLETLKDIQNGNV